MSRDPYSSREQDVLATDCSSGLSWVKKTKGKHFSDPLLRWPVSASCCQRKNSPRSALLTSVYCGVTLHQIKLGSLSYALNERFSQFGQQNLFGIAMYVYSHEHFTVITTKNV